MLSTSNGIIIKCNRVKFLISLALIAVITFGIGLYSKCLFAGKSDVLDRILLNKYPTKNGASGSTTMNKISYNMEEEEDSLDDDDDDNDDDDGDGDDGEYQHHDSSNDKILPASGIHLGVEFHDMKDISLFLDERKVSKSLVNVIEKTSMRLLSYHCSSSSDGVNLKEKSVNCFGILNNKSHIFVHTYIDPITNGTIAIDLLLSDETQLIILDKVLPTLHDEFMNYNSIGSNDVTDKLRNTRWKAFLRNSLQDDVFVRHFCWNDLCSEYLCFKNQLKTQITSVESPFQRIDVWDIVDPRRLRFDSYFKSLSDDGSYESRHPELHQPQRVIFLDGVTQSLSKGIEAYHEALVQPAMFAHKNPRRVAIIGGGEGATLREALKHRSVTNVTMIDIDEIMCKISAKVLYPLWNSCDDFIYESNSSLTISSCFDDSRAHVQYEDALAWFIQRFSNVEHENDKFDVVIMDALDPQDTVEFANILYQDLTFWKSVYNAITDNGILVAQLGNSPFIDDGADTSTYHKRRAAIIDVLHDVGFQTTHAYEESHGNFDEPWSFLVICKSYECNHNWYANPAQVELAIQQRVLSSKSGLPLLKYFDGATMAAYRVPHKGLEAVYCRKVPTPIECLAVDNIHKKQLRNIKKKVIVLVHMGTSIPLVLDQEKEYVDKILQGTQDENHTTALHHNRLIPMITKLTGPSSVERVGYYLKSCPDSFLSPVDSHCSLNRSYSEGGQNDSNSSATSLFYSPFLNRHIPLFGYLENHK